MGITHLAFADDLMLFAKGDRKSVEVLMKALNDFERTSGLAINAEKSQLFGAGIKEDLSFTRIPAGTLPVKYLGVPLDGQRLKVAQFSPLIDSINGCIGAWKGHTLSYVGRLELIKSVIHGVVGFWIREFPLPTMVIDHIESLCKKFSLGFKESTGGQGRCLLT